MEVIRTLSVASTTPDRRDDTAMAAAHAAQEPPFQFVQLLGVFRRNIRLLLLSGLLGAALAYAAATMFQKFTAEALILVEPSPTSAANPAAGGVPSSDEQMQIETHVMTLGSYASMARVLSSFGPGDENTRQTFTMRNLQRNLKAQQGLRSRIISLSFSDKDPVLAAAVANRAVELYVAEQQDGPRREVVQRLTRMQARAAALKEEIEAAAAAGGPPSGDADQQRRLRESLILASGLQRQKDVIDRDGVPSRGVRVLSPAMVPERPSTGTPAIIAIPAFLAFAIFGFFLALLIERSDRSLRSEQEVEAALGIRCLGLVPRMRRSADPRMLGRRLAAQPGSVYGEAIRALLFEQVIGAGDLPKVVLVTSAVPREGKSTLALGLAACAARLDRKVLLVDLNWRAQMRKRKSRDQRAGLLDMLDPVSRSGAAIEPVPNLNFDRVAIGRPACDPSAVIVDKPFAELIDRLRETYDLIVIDGPDLHGAAEASSLLPLADKVLLAVRWGHTRREFPQRALHRLFGLHSFRFHGADRVGAVLTCVRLRRHALYRFGDRAEHLSSI